MIKKLFILSIILLSSFSSIGQFKTTKSKMAESLLEEEKYFAALKIYLDIAKSENEDKELYMKIAQLHEQLYNYAEAAKWYYELFEIQNGSYPKSEFKFAELIMRQGKYKEALEHFTSFKKSYKGHDKALYSTLCKSYIKSCKIALEKLPNAEISIRKVPNHINSSYTDLAPFGYDGELYFSSIPTDTALTYTEYLDSAPAFQIYKAKLTKDDQFEKAEVFIPQILNEPFKHTSNGSFSTDGKKFFFTRCKKNIDGVNICKIYCTLKKDSTWQEPVMLGSEINDKNNTFSSTHPTLMSYIKKGRSKQMINKLVFASTMPGGSGGYDLWMVDISDDLTVGSPENLGKKVNSAQNEVTPFYASKTKKLFFSSNGHGGLGGLDVFEAPIKKGKTKKIKLADKPINSSQDDWYYNELSSSTAFVVSNRKGARVYHNNIPHDDIFLLKRETKKFLSLYAYEKGDSLNSKVRGTIFKVKFANDKIGQGKLVEMNQPFQVIPNKTYEITAQKNGYLNYSMLFSTSYDTKSDSLKLEFFLKKIELNQETTIDAIYFESNSSELKPASKQSLNKLFKTLLANPSLRVEIGGHTDSEGSPDYNMDLSQKRAQAVVDYLVNLGIGEDVLTAKGYGDTQPLTDEKKSELNRRIEYRITNLNNIEDKNNTQED